MEWRQDLGIGGLWVGIGRGKGEARIELCGTL